jgi:YHS domain-containing protein
MMNRLILLVSLAAALAASPGLAQAAGSPAFANSTPGVSGYDVVSYQTGEKPLRGNGNHVSVYDGVTYLFVSEANRKAFERDPDRYVPAYGGYCAYGVSVGKKFVGDPDVWAVVDGRLYLNLDTRIQQIWSKDVPGSITKADKKWPAIQNQSPAAR